MRAVRESLASGAVPLWRHPEWVERFPWLVQGTTGAGGGDEPFDLGLFGVQPVGAVLGRWRTLLAALEVDSAVHARQVHGADVRVHETGCEGIRILDGYDGHVTEAAGVLLTVSVADCVPIFVVDPVRRAVAVLHAGWRGAAAGVLERGIAALRDRGHEAADLWIHCGPAICARRYEVGPEVHAAVNPERPTPEAPTPIDLRAALARRAAAAGVPEPQISGSEWCTRCGPGEFFSHRGGSAARQVGVVAIR